MITFFILIDSIIFQIMKTPANKSCTAQKNPQKQSQTWYRSPWARRWSRGTPGHWCSFGDNLGTGRLHPSPCTDLHRELQGKGSRSIPGAGNVPSHHSLKVLIGKIRFIPTRVRAGCTWNYPTGFALFPNSQLRMSSLFPLFLPARAFPNQGFHSSPHQLPLDPLLRSNLTANHEVRKENKTTKQQRNPKKNPLVLSLSSAPAQESPRLRVWISKDQV